MANKSLNPLKNHKHRVKFSSFKSSKYYMSNLSNNFIAGDWITGPSSISNINPSDTHDVIGEYAQASKSQLEDALNSAQIAQKQW